MSSAVHKNNNNEIPLYTSLISLKTKEMIRKVAMVALAIIAAGSVLAAAAAGMNYIPFIVLYGAAPSFILSLVALVILSRISFENEEESSNPDEPPVNPGAPKIIGHNPPFTPAPDTSISNVNAPVPGALNTAMNVQSPTSNDTPGNVTGSTSDSGLTLKRLEDDLGSISSDDEDNDSEFCDDLEDLPNSDESNNTPPPQEDVKTTKENGVTTVIKKGKMTKTLFPDQGIPTTTEFSPKEKTYDSDVLKSFTFQHLVTFEITEETGVAKTSSNTQEIPEPVFEQPLNFDKLKDDYNKAKPMAQATLLRNQKSIIEKAIDLEMGKLIAYPNTTETLITQWINEIKTSVSQFEEYCMQQSLRQTIKIPVEGDIFTQWKNAQEVIQQRQMELAGLSSLEIMEKEFLYQIADFQILDTASQLDKKAQLSQFSKKILEELSKKIAKDLYDTIQSEEDAAKLKKICHNIIFKVNEKIDHYNKKLDVHNRADLLVFNEDKNLLIDIVQMLWKRDVTPLLHPKEILDDSNEETANSLELKPPIALTLDSVNKTLTLESQEKILKSFKPLLTLLNFLPEKKLQFKDTICKHMVTYFCLHLWDTSTTTKELPEFIKPLLDFCEIYFFPPSEISTPLGEILMILQYFNIDCESTSQYYQLLVEIRQRILKLPPLKEVDKHYGPLLLILLEMYVKIGSKVFNNGDLSLEKYITYELSAISEYLGVDLPERHIEFIQDHKHDELEAAKATAEDLFTAWRNGELINYAVIYQLSQLNPPKIAIEVCKYLVVNHEKDLPKPFKEEIGKVLIDQIKRLNVREARTVCSEIITKYITVFHPKTMGELGSLQQELR